MSRTTPEAEGTQATRVVVSYPADLSGWGQFQIDTRHFKAYLRKHKQGPAREGDVWNEFLDVGCCGSSLDVPLQVERLEGGSEIGPETELVYEEREACGVEGGWAVQRAEGADD